MKDIIKYILAPTAFVGAVTWVTLSSLPEDSVWHKPADSIGISIQDGSRCTPWVLNNVKGGGFDGQLIYNGHCWSSEGGVVEVTFPSSYFSPKRVVYCHTLSAYSPWEELDYAVIDCVGDIPPALPLDLTTDLKKGMRLAHISSNCNYFNDPNCRVERMIDISEQNCRIKGLDFNNGKNFIHDCSSLGGSSGSPVMLFDNPGVVVGLHNLEFGRYDESSPWGEGNGTIHIKKVAKELRELGIAFEEWQPVEENAVEKPVVKLTWWQLFLKFLKGA